MSEHLKKENERETVYCEDIIELKEQILPMLYSNEESWANKINVMISESGYTKKKFANICEVSRVAVNKWCNGSIPRTRETFIKIGLAAGYDRKEMDTLLKKYAKQPALHAKRIEDFACLHVLSNTLCGEEAVVKFTDTLNRIRSIVETVKQNQAVCVDEDAIESLLSNKKTDQEIDIFVEEHVGMFSRPYQRLCSYIKMYLSVNFLEHGEKMYEVAERNHWSSSLRVSISNISQSKWIPTRNKILSLGLHLNMTYDQMNKLLKLAYMDPLYETNASERVIIFILKYAELTKLFDDEEEYNATELVHFASDILKEIDMPEISNFVKELAGIEDKNEW